MINIFYGVIYEKEIILIFKVGELIMNLNILKQSFRVTIPVMAGYVVLGAAFGILMTDKGYNIWWILLMSSMIYAGSMQFVAINLLTSGASIISTALITFMVNARHLFYGMSMLDKYESTGKLKPYLIFSLTDETYALVCGEISNDINKKYYYFFISLLNQIYWLIGSLIGSIIGASLKINTMGIDFAMTSLFVVIFTEQILSKKDYTSAIIGVCSSIACLLLFGSENFLIPTMILITISLLILGVAKKEGVNNEQNSL